MKVVGFGRSDDEFTAILEQPYINGNFAQNEEIEFYITNRFNATKDHSVAGDTSYLSAQYLLQDLKAKNVIAHTNTQGLTELHVIDGDFYYRHP